LFKKYNNTNVTLAVVKIWSIWRKRCEGHRKCKVLRRK